MLKVKVDHSSTHNVDSFQSQSWVLQHQSIFGFRLLNSILTLLTKSSLSRSEGMRLREVNLN